MFRKYVSDVRRIEALHENSVSTGKELQSEEVNQKLPQIGIPS